MDNPATARNTPAPSRSWGPDRRLLWVTALMLLGGAAWFAVDRNAENRLVGAVIALAGLVLTAVLLRVRVRLAAGPDGLVIRGPLHLRRVPWDRIASISTPLRGRFGRRAASLEIDIYDAPREEGQDTVLVVFGSVELGTDPAAVGRALRLMRP